MFDWLLDPAVHALPKFSSVSCIVYHIFVWVTTPEIHM